MRHKHMPKGLKKAEFFVGLALYLAGVTLTHAEPIYRCAEAYSTSSQCGHTAATEVKPSSVLHTAAQDKNNSSTQELRDAQVLEKQRLQTERQAAQQTAIRLNTPASVPTHIASNDTQANNTQRKGKHNRQLHSPYFTAVDPSATPKKKSTAKAVPEKATSQP